MSENVIKYIENSEIGQKNVLDLTEKDYQNFFNNVAKEYNTGIRKFPKNILIFEDGYSP